LNVRWLKICPSFIIWQFLELFYSEQVMVEGMKIALALSETKAFKAVGSKLWDKVAMPGTQYPY
jgi:hypothetical protein